MTLAHSMFLGLLRGITEFIPVSSDGHEMLARTLLKVERPSAAFDVLLHAASLLAILIYFRREILSVFTIRRYLIPVLIVGTVPVAIVGGFYQQQIVALLDSPVAVGIGLIATGTALRLGEYFATDQRTLDELTIGDALFVGVAQAFALAPGVSRAGMTLSSGLGRGLERNTAVAFSFLLGAMAILGAAVVRCKDGIEVGARSDWGTMAAGFAVSLVASLASLVLLSDLARRKRLSWCAIYCYVLGAVVLLAKLFAVW